MLIDPCRLQPNVMFITHDVMHNLLRSRNRITFSSPRGFNAERRTPPPAPRTAWVVVALLILFGDPGSNSWIAKALPQLPVSWTRESLRFGTSEYSSAKHVPALIVPNPLNDASDRYLVLNSGHTFREAELNKLNYLLFPRWGDWAILEVDALPQVRLPLAETVVRAGYFDEHWKAR